MDIPLELHARMTLSEGSDDRVPIATPRLVASSIRILGMLFCSMFNRTHYHLAVHG
jgi:hypothetical protein